MRSFFKKFSRDERGVSALEYAILAGVVVVAVAAGGVLLSGGINTAFTTLKTKLTAVGT